MTIGERLKALRESAGISLKKLSQDIMVNYSTLSNYERDYRVPELKTLIKLSEYYNTPIDVIVGNEKVGKKIKYENFLRVFNKKIIPVLRLKDIIFDNLSIHYLKPYNEKDIIDVVILPRGMKGDYGIIMEDKNWAPVMNKDDIAVVQMNWRDTDEDDIFLLEKPFGFRKISEIEGGVIMYIGNDFENAEFSEDSFDELIEYKCLKGKVTAIIKNEYRELNFSEFDGYDECDEYGKYYGPDE